MAAPDEYIGKTVAGKYKVEVMLGEGGMGKVYKAIQLTLDKPVVLKVLRQALLSDERTVARFQREAKAASRLNHMNSISVLDFGQSEDGAMYIAMEYVQGKDLHHILSREWPLPEARIIRIMTQVLSALADAHTAGVIHRDLKPENIMVEQRRGEADFVKVLDFGIAKIVDGTDDEGPALTKAGFVCGTPEYMSPEQARGAKLDHRSDLYAVGVILYQLTTGLLPFDSDSAVGFATKHLMEVPQPPTTRRPDAKISPSMERLVLRAMAKNPDERPQTAEQFRAELQAIEKERRASVATTARRAPSRMAADGAGPRRATPVDQQDTKVTGPPSSASAWAAADTTVKLSNAPIKLTNTADTAPIVPTTRNPVALKVVTAVLVLAAFGLAGVYGFQRFGGGSRAAVVNEVSPVALELAPANRRPSDAARLSLDGDTAFARGNLEVALQHYLAAWQADTTPGIALKIGEVLWQQEKVTDAQAWWARHRRDAPSSKALGYIDASAQRLTR